MEEVGISCPVNEKRVNEIVVRMVAMEVVFLTLATLILQHPAPAILLAVDFGLRAFGFSKYSPLRYIAQKTVSHFQLGYVSTNEAPKRFAAKIGLGMTFALALLLIYGSNLVAIIVGSILVLFASLEGGFGYCVGCIFYQKLHQLKLLNPK